MPPLLPSLRLAAIAATLSPTPLRADAPSSDGAAEVDADAAQQRAGGIIARTASPFCPGKTLEACPSPGAAEWRADIRRWTAAGALAAMAQFAFANAEYLELWGPAVGTDAPLLAADDQDGNRQTLETLTGTNGLLLVFSRSVDW